MLTFSDFYALFLMGFVYAMPFLLVAALVDIWWGNLTRQQQIKIIRKLGGSK